VTLDGEPVASFDSDKVRALLFYLAIEPDRPHRREALAGLLWPEYPDRAARANLRRALANLRTAIADRQATPPFLRITQQTIQFNSASDAWCDATAFAELLGESGASQLTTRQLEEAVELYRGDFLEGFSVGDSVVFEEWALFKREQFRRQALADLRRLAAHHEERGDNERALPYAWRRVELESWQEGAHRQLMRLLALNGQRGAALAQYETCQRALAEELGVEPASETTRLYERIRDGELVEPEPTEKRMLALEDESEPAPVGVPGAPRRRSRWHMALAGVGLLLLVVVGAGLVFAIGGGFGVGETRLPRPAAAQYKEGKIVSPCEGVTPPQICVSDARTGQSTPVTDDLEFEHIGGFSWSPDGQRIAFDAGSDPESTTRHECNLYVIDADGSDLRPITSGDTNDIRPVWSPDGERIAFHRDCRLWIVHPDGSEAQRLSKEAGEFCVGALAWSPDGEQIAFVNTVSAVPLVHSEVWVVNRDGTAPQAIYSFGRPVAPEANLAWSPDGRQIVCCYKEEGAMEEIMLINVDGSGELQMLREVPCSWFPDFWPQWGGAK
jgi:DNA-binding SARP family transcriptional activator